MLMNRSILPFRKENKLQCNTIFCIFKWSWDREFVYVQSNPLIFCVYLQRAHHYFLMAAESGNANALAYLGKVNIVIRSMLYFAWLDIN
jgi:hypothetical protein